MTLVTVDHADIDLSPDEWPGCRTLTDESGTLIVVNDSGLIVWEYPAGVWSSFEMWARS